MQNHQSLGTHPAASTEAAQLKTLSEKVNPVSICHQEKPYFVYVTAVSI